MPTSRLQRSTAALLVLLTSTVLVTGCFRASIAVRVDADGSGSLTIDVVPGKDLRTALGNDLGTVAGQLRASADVRASGTRVTTFDRSDGPGLRIEVPLSNVQDLEVGPGQPAVNPVSGNLLGGVVRRLALTERDGRWSLSAELDLDRLDAGAVGLPGGGLPGLDARPDLELSVSLPGRVRTSNADGTSWGTATWRLAPGATGVRRLEMANEPLPVGPIAAGGSAVLVALVALLVVLRRRRRRRVEEALAADNAAARAAGAAAAGLLAQGAVPADPWGAARPAAVPPSAAAADPEAAAPTEPVAAAPTGPAPGWYPDPTGAHELRWWDGAAWTPHTS